MSAGVEHPTIIDAVAEDPSGQSFVLFIFETREWEGSQERLAQLQAKINNYLSFILDGQMERMYPKSKNKKRRIEVRSPHPLDARTGDFIARVQQQIQSYDVGLLFRLSNTDIVS